MHPNDPEPVLRKKYNARPGQQTPLPKPLLLHLFQRAELINRLLSQFNAFILRVHCMPERIMASSIVYSLIALVQELFTWNS